MAYQEERKMEGKSLEGSIVLEEEKLDIEKWELKLVSKLRSWVKIHSEDEESKSLVGFIDSLGK